MLQKKAIFETVIRFERYSAKRFKKTSWVSSSMYGQLSETSRWWMICNTRLTLQKIGVRLEQKNQENKRSQIALTTHRSNVGLLCLFTFGTLPKLRTIPHYLVVMEGWSGGFGEKLHQIEEILNETNTRLYISDTSIRSRIFSPTNRSSPTQIPI